MTVPPFPTPAAPALGVSRLLVVSTGSAMSTVMPFWIDWLRNTYSELMITVVLTRSAQRFVTQQALASRVNGEILLDVWPEDEGRARHVELAEWAQAILIYPSTLHFMARLALGLADSPVLLAAQCTTSPVAVAPALPPGGVESAAFQAHWATLAARPNVVLVPPDQGKSMTTGRTDAWVPPLLPEVIEMLECRRVELANTEPALDAAAFPAAAVALLADGVRR